MGAAVNGPLESRLNYQLFEIAVLISRISRFRFRFAVNASSTYLEPLTKRSLHRERAFLALARNAKQAIRGWSMEPDAVQRQNKPIECRLVLLGALTSCRDCCSGNLAERLTKCLPAIDDPFLFPCLLGRIHIKLFTVSSVCRSTSYSKI